MPGEQFRDFEATRLFCPVCRKAVPVRKRLLLILAEGEKYDYTCAVCGTSVGDKLVTMRGEGRVIRR
jgi:hypothetical protein